MVVFGFIMLNILFKYLTKNCPNYNYDNYNYNYYNQFNEIYIFSFDFVFSSIFKLMFQLLEQRISYKISINKLD